MLDVAVQAEGWPDHDWEALAARASEAALAQSPFGEWLGFPTVIEVAVRLTSDDAVHALNSEWRGKDKPTNVLSFPMAAEEALGGSDAQGPELMLGDIILARGVCAAEAADKGVPLEDHAAHLMVHGTLHLLGYDHMDEDEAADMEAREVRALARLGIADPYGDRG